jgi:hypothetical protein
MPNDAPAEKTGSAKNSDNVIAHCVDWDNRNDLDVQLRLVLV